MLTVAAAHETKQEPDKRPMVILPKNGKAQRQASPVNVPFLMTLNLETRDIIICPARIAGDIKH